MYGMGVATKAINIYTMYCSYVEKKTCVDMFLTNLDCFFSKKQFEITKCCTMHKTCVQTNQKYHYMFDIYFLFWFKDYFISG